MLDPLPFTEEDGPDEMLNHRRARVEEKEVASTPWNRHWHRWGARKRPLEGENPRERVKSARVQEGTTPYRSGCDVDPGGGIPALCLYS